jgi:hypothetical protein
MAAPAAPRLGRASRVAQRERTRLHVAGRDHRDAEPEAHGMPITRGDRRAQRPDRHHGMLELLVAHQAGIPVLLPPRRGQRRDGPDGGHLRTAPMAPLQLTSGTPRRVADRAL